MKKMSPLAMLKGKKVKKYAEGGDVDWDYEVVADAPLDPSGYDSMPVEVFEQDTYVAPGDWGFGEPTQEELLAYVANMPYQQTTPEQTADIMGQFRQLGIDPSNLLFGGSGVNGASSAVGGLSAVQPMEKATLGGEDSTAGFKTAQGGTQTQPDQFIPVHGKGVWDTVNNRWVDDAGNKGFSLTDDKGNINWGKLLQLGMVGIGGLASFSDAKSKNKAMKDYYARLDQQRADQQAQYQADRAQAQRYYVPSSSFGQTSGTFRRPT